MEKLNNPNCVFCGYPLDGSDEHIIPNCLNGKLHSKNIICQKCNIKFGKILDPHTKEMFNPILLALGLENARSVYSEDPDGRKYLFDGEKSEILTKPHENRIKIGGFTYITVRGNPKYVKKYFKKRAEELLELEYTSLKYDYREITNPSPLIGFEHKIEITPKLILVL
jgi:HNH endonuclease